MKTQVISLIAIILMASFGNSQANGVVAPVVNLILQSDEPLTDRSNITCELELASLSHPVGATIPPSTEYSATYNYKITQRPIDVEVLITSSLLNRVSPVQSTGITLGRTDDPVLNIGEGRETESGQVTFSNFELGSSNSYETLTAHCSFFTIFDEDDAAMSGTPSDFSIGSRIGFSRPGNGPIQTAIDWTIE